MSYEYFWAAVIGVMLGQLLGDFIKGFVKGVRHKKETKKVVKLFEEMNAKELDEALERLI